MPPTKRLSVESGRKASGAATISSYEVEMVEGCYLSEQVTGVAKRRDQFSVHPFAWSAPLTVMKWTHALGPDFAE